MRRQKPSLRNLQYKTIKPEFPERDDDKFLKTTIAEYSGEGPVISYEAVDISLIPPRKRDYSKAKKETAKA